MNSKKKIVIMNDLVFGGGVENVMFDFVDNLNKDKYDITIMSLFYDNNFYNKYSRDVKYTYVNRYNLKNIFIRVFNKIERKIKLSSLYLNNKFKGYDIAIAIKEGDCMVYMSKVHAKKKLAWVHTDYSIFHWTDYLNKTKNLEIEYMKDFDNVVCVSESVKSSVIKTIGDPGNLCVRYNPVNEKNILQKSNQKININHKKNKLLFVTAGRLVKEKAYRRLLEVCKKLNEDKFEYNLWIIGDGEEKEELLKLKELYDLKNVYFLGNQSNPFPYMKQADWFVCSSICEGFSTVQQEATVLGIPVITTDCAGTYELLGDNEYGIITENTKEGLYNGMKKIITDNLTEYYKKKADERKRFVRCSNRMKKIEELF